jgi:hypothetical protein
MGTRIVKALFKTLMWTHLANFIIFQFSQMSKKRGWYNLSQIWQLAMNLSYLGVIFYLLYFVKRCQNMIYGASSVDVDVMWMLFELTYFFIQLFCGMAFLGIAHLMRMNPYFRDHEALESDDNPWNNKDTEDFLRHLKEEYFLLVHNLALPVMDLLIPFGVGFFWIKFDEFGPRNFWISGMLGIICFIPRLYSSVIVWTFGYRGINMRGKAAEPWVKSAFIFNSIMAIALLVYRFAIIGNEAFFDQSQNNMFVIVWLPFELTFKCVIDPAYVIIELFNRPPVIVEEFEHFDSHDKLNEKNTEGHGEHHEGGEAAGDWPETAR